MDRRLQILHLEDMPTDANLVRRELLKGGLDFDIRFVYDRVSFIQALDESLPDIILSDHSLPLFDSTEALTVLLEREIKIPFILITGNISEEFAVEVMKQGAWDYILKDRLSRLPSAIHNALEKYHIENEHRLLLKRLLDEQELHREAERVANFGTWQSDLLSGQSVMSDGAVRILGYAPGELDPYDSSFLKSIHAEDLMRIRMLIDQTIKGSEVSSMDFRITAPNGQLKHIHSEFLIDRDSTGRATRIVGFNQDISRQKQSENKLKENENKYRLLFKNNPLPMWIIDINDFQILDVNDVAIDHYGYSREEFLSMTALDLRPEEEKERFKNLDRNIAYSSSNKQSWIHIKKDSSRIEVEIFAHTIDYEGNKARLILANDISEVKRKEQDLNTVLRNLEQTNQTNSTLLDTLPANIALIDHTGKIILVNSSWKEFANYNNYKDANYGVGENYIAVCQNATGDDSSYSHNIAKGLKGLLSGSMDHFSMVYPCHTPIAKRWFRVEMSPLTLPGESGRGAVIMHLDISDRKLAEIAANELNDKLKASLTQLSDYKTALDHSTIVSITNDKGIITYANENFAKITQYPISELIGKDYRLINSGYHSQSFFKEMWATLRSGQIWKGEVRNQAKDGSFYWVDTTIFPFVDQHGVPYQYMSIRSDITERKKAEEQLLILTRDLEKKVAERTLQLEHSIKELESFSYSVSHDLRAPLRIISGYSKLFIEKYTDKIDADAIGYINTISDNANHMGQLINDILNLSRLGLEALDKTDIDMTVLVSQTYEEQKMAYSPIPNFVHIDSLPSAQCSRNLLKQVWVNLLDNAIKYSSKKENPIIHIGACEAKGENIYYIKDNGAGFDMKYADKLFGVFQRLHTRQDFEGTGVGLALVHRIINRHGGRVWAEGKVNEGATFYFSLPVIM